MLNSGPAVHDVPNHQTPYLLLYTEPVVIPVDEHWGREFEILLGVGANAQKEITARAFEVKGPA